MKSVIVMLLGLLVAPQGEVGKVDSTLDRKVNFAALRTYTWDAGYNAYNPETHKLIVAAIDAEMASRGFTQVAQNGDVRIAYYTVTGTDVDLEALDKLEREGGAGPTPTRARARLVVAMRRATRDTIWTASMREYLDPDPAKLGATIKTVTARLFSTYPRKPAA